MIVDSETIFEPLIKTIETLYYGYVVETNNGIMQSVMTVLDHSGINLLRLIKCYMGGITESNNRQIAYASLNVLCR